MLDAKATKQINAGLEKHNRHIISKETQTLWENAMRDKLSLFVFIVLTLGGGLVIGSLTAPGAWYGLLVQPSFRPPNWLFAPIWTALYIMIAFAGWRVWRQQRFGSPMALWSAQLALNFGWSPLFFAARQIGPALVIIALLLVTIMAFIVVTARRDRLTAALFVPYALWVSFASALNAAFWVLN